MILELEEAGSKLHVVQADVSVEEDVARVLSVCPKPLRGIIHAAGVLDDGVLNQQTVERFERVMAPKVKGAWYLHRMTQETPLDFFVCFSSMTSLLGGGGQGNYAAANAFLDGLMSHRRAMGLPALSINWGAWSQVGMAADLSFQNQGIESIEPEQGQQIFTALLAQSGQTPLDTAQVGVFPIDWKTFLANHATYTSFLNEFNEHIERGDRNNVRSSMLRQQLLELALPERDARLMQHLRAITANVLGLLSGEQVNPAQRLMDLGLDSLMAVEWRNHLTRTLELSLPATLAFDYPTLNLLHSYLVTEMFAGSISTDESTDSQTASSMDGLTQDELAALLLQEFLQED